MRVSGRLIAWTTFVGAFAALGYASRFVGGTEPPEDVLYRYSTAVVSLLEFTIVLGIVLAIARPRFRELLALRRPTSWGLAAGIAVAIFIGILILGAALEPLLEPGEEQGLVPDEWQPDRAGAFAVNFAVVALVAPVIEELTFRGLGYSLLEQYGRWVAIGLIGLAFGLAHGLLAGLPVLFAFGAGLAYLRSRTGSVYPCILVHGAFNALVLTLAVTVDRAGAG